MTAAPALGERRGNGGPWKRWKTKQRFSTRSHRPWKSQGDFHIPTAPAVVAWFADGDAEISHCAAWKSGNRKRRDSHFPTPPGNKEGAWSGKGVEFRRVPRPKSENPIVKMRQATL